MNEEMTVAGEAAKRAGKVVMGNFGKANTWNKGGDQLVTESDIQSEKILVNAIKKHFPDHGIVSEEAGAVNQGEEYWIIDPLDGTHNYVFGIPVFSVCIGLVDKKGVKNCVVYDPVKDDLFRAERGKGAFRNGKRISVSTKKTISQSVIGIPYSVFKEGIPSGILKRFGEVRALGSAGITYSLVASGSIDAKVKIGDWYWSEFPATLLITEAGGKVSQWDGKQVTVDSHKALLSNGKLHGKILKLLSSHE